MRFNNVLIKSKAISLMLVTALLTTSAGYASASDIIQKTVASTEAPVTVEVTAEVKSEVKSEVKPEVKVSKSDTLKSVIATPYTKLTSKEISATVDKLVSKYPTILSKEVIGTSSDGKPMFAVVLAANSELAEATSEEAYHVIVESGTHSREIANPYITLKMLQDYAGDYYNDSIVKSFNLKDLMVTKKVVFHFMLLSNPDGYDVVKGGLTTLKNKTLASAVRRFGNTTRLKASATGVDLNRNYPATYYNVKSKKWINMWGANASGEVSYKPALEFFYGYSPASEPETVANIKYFDKHDYRFIVSYHSRGEVIYYDRTYLKLPSYGRLSLMYGNIASKASNFKLMPPSPKTTNSGYMGDYFANNSLRPAITIETCTTVGTTTQKEADRMYTKTRDIPLLMTLQALKEGKAKYKVYDSTGKYYKDFIDKSYAEAVAQKIKGKAK